VIVVYEARAGRACRRDGCAGPALGGAIGNLNRPAAPGYVVDFVDLGIGRALVHVQCRGRAISTAVLLLVLIAVVPGLGRRRAVADAAAAGAAAGGPRDHRPCGDGAGPRRSCGRGPDRPVAELRPEAHLGRGPHSGGARVRASDVLPAGAQLPACRPPRSRLTSRPRRSTCRSVYEDDDLLVVDKPAGLVVHPSAGHASGTLVNALLARDTTYGGIAGVQRPGIVHRLDRDTTAS